MTDYTLETPTNLTGTDSHVIAGAEYGSPFQSWKVYDSSTSTSWFGNSDTGCWIGWDFGSGVTKDIVRIKWYDADVPYPSNYATSYKLEYSDNGTSWSEAFSGSHSASGWSTDDFTSAGAHRYWRIRCITCNTNRESWTVASIEMYTASSSDQSVTPAGVASITAFGEAAVTMLIVAAGIASATATGDPALEMNLTAAGVASTTAVGSPVVSAEGAEQTVVPDGVLNSSTVGDPTVAYEQPLTIEGIASITAVGSPTVSAETPGTSVTNPLLYEVEPGVTLGDAIQLILAVTVGRSSVSNGVWTFRDINNTTNRVVGAVGSDGARTSVTTSNA